MSETPKRPEEMSAWERWEMASFDPPKPAAPKPAPAAPAPPPPPAPEPAPAPVVETPPEPAVKLPTADEVEQIYQQAREEGYRVGHAEGRQASLGIAQKIATIVQKLEENVQAMEEVVADELLELSLHVAREVVRESIRLQPEAILAVVREALLQLPHQHAAVYLHPDDAALVREQLGDALSHAGHRIHDDPALNRGDCLLESSNTRIDATLNTRWQRIVATLDSHLPLSPEPDEE